ncbi:hypothetical protein DFH07DRAFT_1061510 [Mycena maculata]|uniref:BTB domain-containing protein n=1 Tax=Mycena maculata TaxID=230809 RepID=A0AAD7IYS0_9AGAR|nr:hypothetical protein DFH07DRAFT_1061510 [Mycena maculata]
MDVDAEPTTPNHVEGLWFEDGNLVIQAGSSQFRVYRGILAARSPVFQDMLSIPQPADAELVDGCPLVRLPDSENEVTVFLKAIFLPQFFRPFPIKTEFDIIAGCLRLSHKYGVDYLRRRALVHLSSGYRTSLTEADNTYHESNPTRPAVEIDSWPAPASHSYKIHVIQLAREVEAPWILPLAFYQLSGSCNLLGRDIYHGTVYNGVHTALSVADQEAFLKGHNLQILSASMDILAFLTDPLTIDVCVSIGDCNMERQNIMPSVREDLRHYPSDPLWATWIAEDWEKLDGVCPPCLAILKETHQAARRAFWDQLPEMYGLPPWEELEAIKTAAIGDDWFA